MASLTHPASQRYGLDINRADIRDAWLRFRQRVSYLCGTAEALPFPSATFDAIIMSEVLEHTRDEARALAEAARLLRPRGVLILTVPHRGPLELTDLTNWKYRLPRLHRTAYGWKHRGDFSRFVPVTQYHRHYTLKRLEQLVSRNFEIAAVRRGGFVLFALADYAALFRHPSLISALWRIAAADYQVDYGLLSYDIALRLCRRSD